MGKCSYQYLKCDYQTLFLQRYDHFKKTKTPTSKKHCNAFIVLRASDEIQLSGKSRLQMAQFWKKLLSEYSKTKKVSRRETNFITGATEKVTKKLNHLDPRSFLVENYQIIDGNADHICQGPGWNFTPIGCSMSYITYAGYVFIPSKVQRYIQ